MCVHLSSSPVVDVLGETGLLSAGVSGQCKLPHCVPQAADVVAAPSRFAPLCFFVASLPDPQQAQNVPGSAIENLRCLRSVKAEINYFVQQQQVFSTTIWAQPWHLIGLTVIRFMLITQQIQRAKSYWLCLWAPRLQSQPSQLSVLFHFILIKRYESFHSHTHSSLAWQIWGQWVVRELLWNDYLCMAPM